MLKLNGDKKTVNWYKYVLNCNKEQKKHLFGFISDVDSLPFVLCLNNSFKAIQKNCHYSTPKLRDCLYRLLCLGVIFPNHYGNFDLVTDDLTSLSARTQAYIFRHDIKAFGKKRFIKAYMS